MAIFAVVERLQPVAACNGVAAAQACGAQALQLWLRLYDELQLTFPNFYEGSFEKIGEVQIYDAKRFEKGNKKYRKTPVLTQFLRKEMKYSYPVGWPYPLYAAFRFLAVSTASEGVSWREDP